MKALVLLLTCCALITAGCRSIYTDSDPRIDLGEMKRFFVERRLADNHHVDRAIVQDLRARGFEAWSGPLTMMPEQVDAIISYHDEWAWDFKSYVIQLDIRIRAAHREQTLAVGTYRQPTPFTKQPAQVIHTILDSIFQQP